MKNNSENEQRRLAELYSFNILDTPKEPEYDRLVRLAAKHYEVPIALITLVDDSRQWFKAVVGLSIQETSRTVSFCTHTIEQGKILVVEDARVDPEFADNPLVTGHPGLVFYAGVPLITPRNEILGTLAILDVCPRSMDLQNLELLQILAEQIMVHLELRRYVANLSSMTLERDNLKSAQLRDSQVRYERIAKATTDTIWDWDLQTDIITWNDGLQTSFGYAPEEIEPDSSSWTNRIHPEDLEAVSSGIHAAIESGDENWEATYRMRRKNGSFANVFDRGFVLHDSKGKAVRMIGGISDVSDRFAVEEANRQIKKLAFFDSLTGLPNRTLMLERLESAFSRLTDDTESGALFFIDLDNFKSLNDTLGHDKGDALLRQVAERLIGCSRARDTVARLGGDEFVILIENLPFQNAERQAIANRLAERIIESFIIEFHIDNHRCRTTPSIGIAFFDHRSNSIDELLKAADLAMYEAKAAGRNTVRFFNPEMQANVNNRRDLENEMRTALQQNQYSLFYQPILDDKFKLIGAEALIRWQHPARGWISPGEFINIAEETGLIIPIGQWVVNAACSQLAVWGSSVETEHLTLSINVSVRQLRDPDFSRRVIESLELSGANADRLKIELTESIFVNDVDSTIATMEALKQVGVGFSLDDFGTGYSSLAYLRKLPFDQLKIDRSFVNDIAVNGNDAVIAQTIITLAHSLGLTTVAEGVETEQQRDILLDNRCDSFQGFLFGRPIPMGQFERIWIESARLAC